jgi:hypothetical protein
MLKTVIPAAVAAAVIAALAVPAAAHHSFVMFDKNKEATLTGTVKQFENSNPHATIVLTTQDGKDWLIQSESPLVLEKVGINDSTLSKGEKATIRVHPIKSGKPEGSLIELTTEDGMMMSLGSHAYGELMKEAHVKEAPAKKK